MSILFDWQLDLLKDQMTSAALTMFSEINNKTHMPEVLAVDGDILAYRIAAVCEHDFEGACYPIIATTLEKIAFDTGINAFRIYLSGKDNFRFDKAKTKRYKGNRDNIVRPQFLQACIEHLKTKYNAIVMNGAEADDGIASDMKQYGAIHCGIDKDILQVAGKHYNWTKENPDERWIEVSEDQAIINLYRQVLKGDASDNIPGLPRIGDKKAADQIRNAQTAEEDALAMYQEVCAKSLPEVNYIEYMAEQLSLIKMRTNLSIDISKTVIIRAANEFSSEEGFEDFESKPVENKGIKL